MSGEARVAVVVPSDNDAKLVAETVRSVAEDEPVEIVIVDKGPVDGASQDALAGLEADGCRLVHVPGDAGPAALRTAGIAATRAPYVFILEPGNLGVPRALGQMADRLDQNPDAGACVGAYEELEVRTLVRTVPKRLDAYRVAFTNEYPPSALFRRTALVEVGGWTRLIAELDARADWGLWMSLAERGLEGNHVGAGLTYLRRMHSGRLAWAGRAYNLRLYAALREQHPRLFSRLRENRAASDLSPARARLYPIVYGRRPRVKAETFIKAAMDKVGIWTLTGALDAAGRRQIVAALNSAQRHRPAPSGGSDATARVAVVIPCHNDGEFVGDTVRSIDEPEPVEAVVVDDGSPDERTHSALDELENDGYRVIRLPSNRGVSAARNAGLDATTAPYVFPLDADDLAIPGMLSRMADRLDSSPRMAVCFGDYVEFRLDRAVRAAPERGDPHRLTTSTDNPPAAMFRRATIEALGTSGDGGSVSADPDLWKTLVKRKIPTVRLESGEPSYRRRTLVD